jgi:predicted ATPase
MSMKRIVLAGGPGSGKSTILEALILRFQNELCVVEEAATYLIVNCWFKPPFFGEYLLLFQARVSNLQREWEDAGVGQAQENGMKGILCDRGRVDGPAYLQGNILEWETLLKTTLQAELSRYTLVLFLEMPDEAQYRRIASSNPVRFEPWKEAKPLSDRLTAAWSLHPQFNRIPYIPVPDRIAHVESLIQAHINDCK